jgi:hypothetical protein
LVDRRRRTCPPTARRGCPNRIVGDAFWDGLVGPATGAERRFGAPSSSPSGASCRDSAPIVDGRATATFGAACSAPRSLGWLTAIPVDTACPERAGSNVLRGCSGRRRWASHVSRSSRPERAGFIRTPLLMRAHRAGAGGHRVCRSAALFSGARSGREARQPASGGGDKPGRLVAGSSTAPRSGTHTPQRGAEQLTAPRWLGPTGS